MVIGCVNDAPVPVLDIVSGADVTTEASVVGKAPGNAAPFASTPGEDDCMELTTELSAVGNGVGSTGADDGDPVFVAVAISGLGNASSPVRCAFSMIVC